MIDIPLDIVIGILVVVFSLGFIYFVYCVGSGVKYEDDE